MKLKIDNTGTITAIYNDALVPLFENGHVSIKRASHVEPTPAGQWEADMSPIQPGVVLGPFTTRRRALDAEIEWLSSRL